MTLALALVVRITVAERPFEGFSPALALAFGALTGLAVWTLASALWSNAPARALAEFDRTLLYALVLVLTGSAVARVGDLATVLRWTAAAFAAIALAGLLTRLLPDTFPISAGFLPERVSFPVTYWNAMGIACALGALLLAHLTVSSAEHPAVRIVAAALLAPTAVTLYLTFSRGAIWVLPVGVVLYVLLAQPRGLLTGLPAAGIPAAIAVKVAYGADLLARADYDASAAAASQGRDVALVVLACALGAAALRAAALPLDRRIDAFYIDEDNKRFLRLALSGGLVLALLIGALAADAPRRISDARATFSEGRYMDYEADLRTRLTSTVDNGRVDAWRVALDDAERNPLKGSGAGTYRLVWDQERPPPPMKVIDGHSLYLETLSELGVVGLVLVLVAIGTILVGGLLRLGGPERHAHGALVAAGAMLALHAGVDWDWEMPVLFVWLFGAGGVVLASRRPASGRAGPHAADRRRAGRAGAGDHAGAVRVFAAAAGPCRGARSRSATAGRGSTPRWTRPSGSGSGPSRGRSSATATRAPGSSSSRAGRWTPRARATRTTGSSRTARRSSTACPASTRGRSRPRRCG